MDHYARVLRDPCAALLARALTPTDFAPLFAGPDQLFPFSPSTASMRPILDMRLGIHVSTIPVADASGEREDDVQTEPLDHV